MLSAKERLTICKKRLKRYTKDKNGGDTHENGRWLSDNALLLRSSVENALRCLRKSRVKNVDGFFDSLLSALDTVSTENTEADIVRALKSNGVELEMNEMFATLTFGAACVRATEIYKSNPEGFPSAVKLIFSLRLVDFDAILPEVCLAEHILTLDPVGIYTKCDTATKRMYRKSLCKKAEKENTTTSLAAEKALDTAKASTGELRHIGFHLGIPKTDKTKGASFIVAEAVFSLAVSVCASLLCTQSSDSFFGTVFGQILLSALIFLPVYSAVRPISERISAHIFKPAFTPSLDSESDCCLPSAVIAVSSVLPSSDKIGAVKEHLRETMLSDDSEGTVLVFLCDLKNADVTVLPEDEADIRAAEKMTDELNREHGGGFVFALRDRVFAPSENSYGGHERKRGALCTLVKYISSGENGFSVLTGDISPLKRAKYLLALDSDTVLPFESLRKLVCIAAHPFNRPVFSPEERKITQGYGIIAPRIETTPSSAEKTFFSSFMTLGGISAYSSPVSERYMDMFSTSLFTGKGLIDIDSFYKTCVNAFPDGLILSHDIPEGAIMNSAFAGGVCLSDSFPSKPSAYRKREHRWIRGDVQNLRLLKGTTSGSPFSPSLSALARYQLLDNLRRAVSPVTQLLCLILSVITGGKASLVLFFVSLVSVISEPLISFLSELIHLGVKALTSVYLTASAGVGIKSLIRSVYLTASLPEATFVSLSAVAKGAYRAFVSKKKTLEWTTAADGEHGRGNIIPCVFSVLCCVFLFCFGNPLHKLWSILILFNVPFSFSNGIINTKTVEKLSETSRETLKSYSAAEWRYFEKYVTDEDNFLPPDNVQFTPVRRTAHRTSPTDIGMYLLSCLAASDLSLITQDELLSRLTQTVATLKKLKRCCGLLYNWYDTKTLDVLQPYFVSTVDCGNYLCCLLTLGEGLKKRSDDRRFDGILSFINAEITSSDLSVLFSRRRGLFSVGLNGADKTLSKSYYDTYMSEMRLTSFYATALREVPVSHNEKLSRSSVSSGVYTSAASWTGTAFEYLMPTLFLPIFDNTFIGEALFNCVREQKKASRRTQMPWGISESGYYAFDSELNYRYKAHGIRRLAIKADADCENVFSPYSSFLALAIAPEASMKNLAKFVTLGGFGACGFYEALDFTPERVAPESYMLVRSFMAHHKGMSLIACVNTLYDNIFVRRFMGNPKMKAAQSLLNEKLPQEAPFMSRLKRKKNGVRKKYSPGIGKNADNPSCAFFSDGEASLLSTDTGRNKFVYSSLSVLASRRCVSGIFAAVNTQNGIVPMTGIDKGQLTSTSFYNKRITESGVFEHALCLSRNTAAVFAPLKISNTTDSEKIYELLFYAEPELLPVNGTVAHKSYSDMFIRTQEVKHLSCITFERREKGKVVGAVAFGFADSEPFVFTCRRSKTLIGSDSCVFPFEKRIPSFDNSVCDVSPCFAASITIRLKPNEKREKVLIAVAGDDKTDAVNKLSVLRSKSLPNRKSTSPDRIMLASGIRRSCEEFLLTRFFGKTPCVSAADAVKRNRLPVNGLWERGISGDYGIIRVSADDTPPSLFSDFISFHAFLGKAGIACDLVFTLYSPDDYSSSSSEKLRGIIKKHHAEALIGLSGGIHIVNLNIGSPSDILLTAAANAVFPVGSDEEKEGDRPVLPACPNKCRRAVSGNDGFIPNGYFINSKHTFPMSHTLSNGIIGTLLTDTSLGFTFFANARLCPLTPRPFDISELPNGEMLTLEEGTTITDCINGASVFFFGSKAVYRSEINAVRCDTTVTVAEKGAVKNIHVRLSGIQSRCRLVFSFTPVLHENADFGRLCNVELREKEIAVFNPFNTDYRGIMLVSCPDCTTERDKNGRLCLSIAFSGDEESFETDIKMAFSATEKALPKLIQAEHTPFSEKTVRFNTDSDNFNTFANALLYHQTSDTRILSRTGYYQCSGAYGFRDQLQDAMCIVDFDPVKTRRMICLCASAQFREGDVLHWFHLIPSQGKKGIRTRCSDDMLWLPLAAADYAERTGDSSVFEIRVPYLEGSTLTNTEKKRYDLYKRSVLSGSIYEHCMKSIFRACKFGSHGLPLILNGDWNDSFDEIGSLGLGESVWLGMLLKAVCDKMTPFAARFGKTEHRELLEKISEQMNRRILSEGYNGQFFTRAFFDDGTPLGDGSSEACKIDLLPQAFASFSSVGTSEQRKKALITAYRELVDTENKTVLLFKPPFGDSSRRAGYVNDYPKGVRENGGQYTHAAVWFALALLNEGLTVEAAAVTQLLLPSLKGKTYEREPYALCGDVYSAQGMEGKGGWSLYTGSAGWMIRLASAWEKQRNGKEKQESLS